jgi:hypothetical protein
MQYATPSLVVALCALTLACQRPYDVDLQPTIEEPRAVPNAIRVGDASTSNQFVKGFYDLHSNTWSWTAPNFNVVLGTPAGASSSGATLVLDFSLPDASVNALKNITLAAKIGDVALAPETITAAGDHEYRREVPASALTKDTVIVDFAVDKFLKPANDSRELGLVAKAVRLESK